MEISAANIIRSTSPRRAFIIMLAPVASVALALLMPVSSASANIKHPSTHEVVSACPIRNAWAGVSPSQCNAKDLKTYKVIPTLGHKIFGIRMPRAGYGIGCNGLYTGTGHPWMTCKDSAVATNGYRVVDRAGYWQPVANPQGFGRDKLFESHNLWVQPTIDTIALSLSHGGSTSDREYSAYHYNPDGYVDQEVDVYSDNSDTSFAGKPTQDGHTVGVITGFCKPGIGLPREQSCPDWIDNSL